MSRGVSAATKPGPFGRSPVNRSEEERPCLPSLAGGGEAIGQEGKVGHQGMGLLFGIVLPQGDEEDALLFQQGGDVLEIGGHSVVGGKSQKQGTALTEVGLDGHGHGGIGDPEGDLSQGITGTGCHDQRLQGTGGAQGLGLRDSQHGRAAADGLGRMEKIRRATEAGIGGGGVEAEDGEQLLTLLGQLPQGGKGGGKGAVRAAEGKADPRATSVMRL